MLHPALRAPGRLRLAAKRFVFDPFFIAGQTSLWPKSPCSVQPSLGDVCILKQCPSMLLIHSWCGPAAHCPHGAPQHTPYCKVHTRVLPTARSAQRYLEMLFSIYPNTAKSPCVGALCSPKQLCLVMQIIPPSHHEILCCILVYIIYIHYIYIKASKITMPYVPVTAVSQVLYYRRFPDLTEENMTNFVESRGVF